MKRTALEDWLDTATVLDMLGISARTLQHYRSECILPYVKMGNKIYYKRADIEDYLDRLYVEQNPEKGGPHV